MRMRRRSHGQRKNHWDAVDAKLKAQAEGVLEKLGLNASDAIRLFYKQVALQRGLPFDVKLPNATTRRALKDADDGKNLVRDESFEDFTQAMTGESWLRRPNSTRVIAVGSVPCYQTVGPGQSP